MRRERRPSRWSYRIAEIAGIEVRVHVSMLVLLWLVLFTADGSQSAVALLAWLALIFGGVLLHELAHSLVARRVGVTVTEIELLPIGGVSKMDRIPDQPSDELAIAIAGPLTSVAIGAAALAVAFAAGLTAWPPDLYGGAIVARIGWFNLFVGAFNLLPALPLDGGRVLRAQLERRVGPFEATQRAAHVGRWMGAALVVIGAWLNLFLLFIGVFVYVTARAEETASLVRHALGRVLVRDVMVHEPAVVSDDATVSHLRMLLPYTSQREFAVVDSTGSYVGMVDLSVLGSADDVALAGIADVRPTTGPDDVVASSGILESGKTMAVIDGGRVVGLLELEDVMCLIDRALDRRGRPITS